jgi:hypothetical protein
MNVRKWRFNAAIAFDSMRMTTPGNEETEWTNVAGWKTVLKVKLAAP